MCVQKPVRVVIEIRRTRPTVSGQLAVDGAPASGFYGWLELIDELERASSPPSLESGRMRRAGLVADAGNDGLTRVALRAFTAALREKYGARELEVQVQPIAVKRAVGVGAVIVGTRGERAWLGSDEIRVTTIADPETARLRVWIGAPDGDAALFLADVDSRHATAIRVKLSDLQPDLGRANSAHRSRDRSTGTRSQLADDGGGAVRRTGTGEITDADSGFLTRRTSNNAFGPAANVDGDVPADDIDGTRP